MTNQSNSLSACRRKTSDDICIWVKISQRYCVFNLWGVEGERRVWEVCWKDLRWRIEICTLIWCRVSAHRIERVGKIYCQANVLSEFNPGDCSLIWIFLFPWRLLLLYCHISRSFVIQLSTIKIHINSNPWYSQHGWKSLSTHSKIFKMFSPNSFALKSWFP